VNCAGCERPLGRKGDKPAMRLQYRPDKVSAHRDPGCLSLALQKWMAQQRAATSETSE
jgi:hypothetical protein